MCHTATPPDMLGSNNYSASDPLRAPAHPQATPVPLPKDFVGLGDTCDPNENAEPATASGQEKRVCSDSGRVVGIYQPADAIPQPPDTAVVLAAPTGSDSVDDAYIALESERLWVRRVVCGRCRRVLGWSLIGDIPSMSEQQLLDLQAALGFNNTVPALRTADAWRRQPMPSIASPR